MEGTQWEASLIRLLAASSASAEAGEQESSRAERSQTVWDSCVGSLGITAAAVFFSFVENTDPRGPVLSPINLYCPILQIKATVQCSNSHLFNMCSDPVPLLSANAAVQLKKPYLSTQ